MSSCKLFPLEFDNFICEPYDGSHMVYLSRFDTLELIDDKGKVYTAKHLEESIRDSGRLDDAHLLKTYLVYRLPTDKDPVGTKKELACVFCLRTSSMHFENELRENFFHSIIPSLELVYLAVDKKCRDKHPELKGIGAASFYAFVVPIVQGVSRLCGCKNLFLFAINNAKLVKYYMDQMNFQELPSDQEEFIVNNLKTDDNEDCKFLFQPIECM